MPDLGGLGRGLRQGARQARERAEAAVRRPPADGGTDQEPPDAEEPEQAASAADVAELVALLQRLVAARRPPPGPITEPWSLGVGDLLAEHPRVPERARGLVRRIDVLGGLSLSPTGIGFDGEDVPWPKVTEIRTRHVVDYVLGDAVARQVENLPLPPFPGRRRLLDALGQALLTVVLATARDQLARLELDPRVPVELSYRGGLGRRAELGAGVLGAIVLADPAINAAVVATARDNGVPVVAGDDESLADATRRAVVLREQVTRLEAELARLTRRSGRPAG